MLAPLIVRPANVGESVAPIACPIAIVGAAPSPELLVTVTPVPATSDSTYEPTVSVDKLTASLIHAVPFQRRKSPFAADVIVTSKRSFRFDPDKFPLK